MNKLLKSKRISRLLRRPVKGDQPAEEQSSAAAEASEASLTAKNRVRFLRVKHYIRSHPIAGSKSEGEVRFVQASAPYIGGWNLH